MAYVIIERCSGCSACVRICPAEAITGEKKMIHVINGEHCIDCGACGRVCPENAITDQHGSACRRMKKSEWKRPLFNLEICTSCTNCVETCPAGCIGLKKRPARNDPHSYPYLENEKSCISCGFCAADCPVDAVTMGV